MTLPSGAIVIAGGSGFLGLSLATFLASPATPVVLLSRNAPRAQGPWTHVRWDARTLAHEWHACLNNAAALINLTGRSVDCIKSPDNVDEILRSRVESTLALGRALRNIEKPPPLWLQMSTAHIYGDPPTLLCTEDSPLGHGLAPDVGRAWEHAFHEAALPNQRTVILRTSFVIGRDRGAGCGAMSRFKALARLGLAGTIGHGRQGISWIHETDLNRIFQRALTDASMQGVYIASAPNPVSQREFMRTLRRVMRIPLGLPAPAPLVRLGAKLLLRTDPELALFGRYVISQRLHDADFTFQFPDLEAALTDLLRK